MHADRAGIFGDSQIRHAFGLRRSPGDGREPGGGDDDTRDAEFLCFYGRPHRGRGARPSPTVAGDDRVTAFLLREGRYLLRDSFLRGRVTPDVDDGKLVERNDFDAGIFFLQKAAIRTE